MLIPLSLSFAIAVAAAPTAPVEVAPANTPTQVAAPPDPAQRLEALYRDVEANYARRDEAGALDRIDALLDEADAIAPKRYDTIWRRARNAFWRSDVARDSTTKARFGKLAWSLGEEAVKVDPNGVEGHYYAGIGVGNYSEGISVVKALLEGVESPFLEHLAFVMKHKPSYDVAGSSLAIGRYHYLLPWPKYDGDEAIRVLRAVVANYPHNLRAKVFLAEVLLMEDEPKQALALLDQVEKEVPGKDPPEERFSKRLGRTLRPKVMAELE